MTTIITFDINSQVEGVETQEKEKTNKTDIEPAAVAAESDGVSNGSTNSTGLLETVIQEVSEGVYDAAKDVEETLEHLINLVSLCRSFLGCWIIDVDILLL